MGVAQTRFEALVEWVDRGTERRLFLTVFLPVAAVYLATTTWGVGVNIDPFTNAYTAWAIGATGSPVVEEYHVPDTHRDYVAWLLPDGSGRAISSYPPGAALLASPLYALFARDLTESTLRRSAEEVADLEPVTVGHPAIWPSSVAAALSSAAAVAFAGMIFSGLMSTRIALSGAGVAAFGTSVWSVASDALWQQGPSLMFLMMGLFLTRRQRWWAAGLAFAGAMACRQLVGVVAVAVGLGAAVGARSLVPLFKIGLTSSLGPIGLTWWYHTWFGFARPWGFRTDQVAAVTGQQGAIAPVFSGDVGGPFSVVANQLLGLFDPRFGVLVLSPFLLVALVTLPNAWRQADWVLKGAFLGGVAYYLLQHRIQIFAHFGYLGYRYPLEAFAAMGPIWLLATREGLGRLRLPTLWAVRIALIIHAVFAVLG